jgi:thiol-disulfide isomerase/thioredoxin
MLKGHLSALLVSFMNAYRRVLEYPIVLFYTMIDFNDIRKRSTDVRGYINALSEKDKDIVMEAYEAYHINETALKELQKIAKGLKVIIFSAAWCGDCKQAMPVMLHIEEKTDFDIMVFGNIKTDPLNKDVKWRVPPSPPEINEWGATAIPWFVFFDAKGNKIGTLIEKPTVTATLEEEIVHVLKHK